MSRSEAQRPTSGGTDTHCPHCVLQCAMTLTQLSQRELARGEPLTVSGCAFLTNRGGRCRKGWTSATLLSDLVGISNARGTVHARATLSSGIRPDTVFLPFHFAGHQSADLLTLDATDPVSSMPEFKSSVVRMRPEARET